MVESGSANARWAEMLSGWAIPDGLVAIAPESPYFFDPRVFIDAADEAARRGADTPSDEVARDALPVGGVVLDVGVGAGAASLRLGAARVIGVDPSPAMLAAFTERASRLAVEATAINGTWPDVAADTPRADVAVCHHVAYNVADLAGFSTALGQHAARRVVIELTAVHPMAWLSPYWKALHGIVQPDRPVAADATDVLVELGVEVHQRRWRRPLQMIGESGAERIARIARRLCLAPDRHDELRTLLRRTPPPSERDVVTLWWDAADGHH
jgi:SAM-dependent methyltransferase